MRFAPGSRVRARLLDPDHHIRLPRYVRGHVGEIVEAEGDWQVPDDQVGGAGGVGGAAAARVETVYAVRFPASELWGAGSHTVTVDLWESYLEEAGQ